MMSYLRDCERFARLILIPASPTRKAFCIMNDKLEKIRTISNRLARSLAVLVAIFIPGALYAYTHPGSIITSSPMACFIVGVIGGFVGLQRRLKKMSEDDLTLLANSWVYICLAPLVGGNGGGRPTMARAGGRNPEKLPEALDSAWAWIKATLA